MEKDTERNMADRLYEFITELGGGVSFVEIMHKFGEGEYTIISDLNVVRWCGLTRETAAGITKLLDERRILMYPTNPIVYLIDGCIPQLPIAKQPPKGGYKEPHWAPAVLWTIEQIKAGMKGGYMLTDPLDAAIYREAGYEI